jgi:hypothetical protein
MKLPVRMGLLGLLAACGGPSAEAPLTVNLGITHEAAEHDLHAHQFCRVQGQVDSNHEMYPRCDRTAAELGEAWVNATFEGDKLIELRRWERYPDDEKAVERWNEMLAARAKISSPSDEALQHLRDRGLLPAGTRSVKAFRGADGIVIGVYLITPSPPENANVLEQISYEK